MNRKEENIMNDQQKRIINHAILNVSNPNSEISRDMLIKFADDRNMTYRKNISKEKLAELIKTLYKDELYEFLYPQVSTNIYEMSQYFNLSYKKLYDLEQIEVIKPWHTKTFRGGATRTCYSLDVYEHTGEELNAIWEEKFNTEFYRARFEVKSQSDADVLVAELSKMFEVDSISKLYEHRDADGYYIYLSLRSLNKAARNDDVLRKENLKLKQELSESRTQIEKLSSEKIDSEHLKYEISILKNKNERLKKQLDHAKGGRPKKISDSDKELMKMYKIQGKTYREIAALFKCSLGTVSNILKEQ